jgi:regulator of nucleoside diphosphate kinase
MNNRNCILTTKDFTILEVMRDRYIAADDPLAPILKNKIANAIVVFREDIPVNVATLSSRVTFSVDGREPDTRVLSHDQVTWPVGMFLPITTARGAALLGLAEGEEFVLTNRDGVEECILLETVHYQPEAARREKDAMDALAPSPQRKPALRLVRAGRPQLVPDVPGGYDDPGPAAA